MDKRWCCVSFFLPRHRERYRIHWRRLKLTAISLGNLGETWNRVFWIARVSRGRDELDRKRSIAGSRRIVHLVVFPMSVEPRDGPMGPMTIPKPLNAKEKKFAKPDDRDVGYAESRSDTRHPMLPGIFS